jgi:hypothetical protein
MPGPLTLPRTMFAILRIVPLLWGAPRLISSFEMSHSNLYSQDREGWRIVGPLGNTPFPGDAVVDMMG